jgi:hypothetical protein
MLKSLAGRTYASGKVLNPPLAIYADEAQNVLFHGFEDLVAKVGSANIMFHGFSQSVNQVYVAMGDKSKGKSILDNINTKIFMRVTDEETAEYAAKHFGTRKRLTPMVTIGGTPNMREIEQPLVKPEHVMRLQPQQFYMLTYSGEYKGRTTQVSPSRLKIKYPETGTA